MKNYQFENILVISRHIMFEVEGQEICLEKLISNTCSLVLITSAGVTREAAGIPAMAPATSNDNGVL